MEPDLRVPVRCANVGVAANPSSTLSACLNYGGQTIAEAPMGILGARPNEMPLTFLVLVSS